MKYLSITMVLFMLAVWLFMAAQQFRSANQVRGWRKLITFLAAALITIGALGFFGSALSVIGGLNWLPGSFEWPAGRVRRVVTTADHCFAVPLTALGRVQIYDRNWKFLRAWPVDASGGTFKLYVTDTNHIHVVTARNKMHYVYDTTGAMLSSETYPPTGYASFPAEGRTYTVPTPPWLWMFTSRFYSWLAAVSGMLLLIPRLKASSKKQQAAAEEY